MRKMVILAIVAVLALTSVGFGFAKWSSSVDANVSVQTGNVLIGIRDVGTNDDGDNTGVADYGIVGIGPNQGSYGADPQWTNTYGGLGINSEMKDVASLKSTNDPTVCSYIGMTADETKYYSAITERITNGYPWYGPTTRVQIANLGSIPVKLESFTWSWNSDGTNLDPWFNVVNYTISMPGTATITGSGTANFQTALNHIQLHAGDVLTVEVQIGLSETNASGDLLPQLATGTATSHITASQWNEVQ